MSEAFEHCASAGGEVGNISESGECLLADGRCGKDSIHNDTASGHNSNSEEICESQEIITSKSNFKSDNSVELAVGMSASMSCENNEADLNPLEHQSNTLLQENFEMAEDKEEFCKETLIIGRDGLEENLNLTGCQDAEMQEADLVQESVSSKQDEGAESVLLCRLCAIPCQGSASVYLFRHPPHHPEVVPKNMPDTQDEEAFGDILSMIKATLPIKVSCCDSLPKQVCKACVDRLRLSHAFVAAVLKAESQLNSLRTHQKSGDFDEASNPSNAVLGYDCPVCKEAPVLLSNPSEPEMFLSGNYSWGHVVIKREPEDHIEPTQEELEKSYHDFFGGHENDSFRTEERITLKPSKPAGYTGRRPRGRPRSRPFKVTPRGRRGRRSMQTTVEKILELSETQIADEDYGFSIRSRENNPASEALTQCLLCERWLPGAASCLQHSLGDHMDCGAFLCPRCPRDDFPGDFELIQHYQESHCPDLELYEVFQTERINSSKEQKHESSSQPASKPQCDQVVVEPCEVKQEDIHPQPESPWHGETMDFETLNDAPSLEPYESPDEVSSNLSELAPRSLTSHSAVFEEESNSISTHGSDSNLTQDDILARRADKFRAELSEQTTGLVDEVSFGTLNVVEFSSDLRTMEEESRDNEKLQESEKQTFINAHEKNSVCEDNNDGETNNFKALQEESQDSIRADELCGFQEAINEKSQEVNLNGSDTQFDPRVSSANASDDISNI